MLSPQQIDTILTMAQEFANARANVLCKNFDEYDDFDTMDDLLAEEKACYNELVNYLKGLG